MSVTGGGPVNDEPVAARDARLLDELGTALGPEDTPAGLVERADGLFALRDLDSALVELLDQPAAEPAGMRGGTATARLDFETSDGSVALELVRQGDRLVGQLLAGE